MLEDEVIIRFATFSQHEIFVQYSDFLIFFVIDK